MKDISIHDYQSSLDTAVIELSQGHLFMCKNCTVENTKDSVILESYADLVDIYSSQNFTSAYLDDSTLSEYFASGIDSSKGVIELNYVSANSEITAGSVKIEDILIDGIKFGFRLAKDYQFVKYEPKYWGDRAFGSEVFKWLASDFTYEEYD